MFCKAEVLGKYDHAAAASKLLYAPLHEPLTYRESRRYHIEFTGDAPACQDFLHRVLSDPVSHELHLGEDPALQNYSFYLDYGMKPGALDLEKETILTYFKELKNPAFQLQSVRIQRRIYLYGPANPTLADRFIKDIVNPAVHHHTVKFA